MANKYTLREILNSSSYSCCKEDELRVVVDIEVSNDDGAEDEYLSQCMISFPLDGKRIYCWLGEYGELLSCTSDYFTHRDYAYLLSMSERIRERVRNMYNESYLLKRYISCAPLQNNIEDSLIYKWFTEVAWEDHYLSNEERREMKEFISNHYRRK